MLTVRCGGSVQVLIDRPYQHSKRVQGWLQGSSMPSHVTSGTKNTKRSLTLTKLNSLVELCVCQCVFSYLARLEIVFHTVLKALSF